MTDKSAAAMKASEELRKIAEKWATVWFNAVCERRSNADDLISDLTALISEHYVSREEYNDLLQQRDELKKALISLMWQFAYYGTKNNVAVMHTGGLSALEDAFSALGLSDPITVENFEAAIKNTER